MTRCTVYVGHVNGRSIVRLIGEVDIANAERLRETLELVDGPISVDCAHLVFIDAAGVSALLKVAQEVGGVRLCHVSPHLRRVIDILGLSAQLGVDPVNALPETA
jgi:anti-anti-sigma factor